MTTKKPSAVQGLRRGVGTGPETGHAVADLPSETRQPLTDLPPRPEKPVRFTLDLDQERHAFLKRFALECGAGTGGSVVMRALLDELRDSTTLSMKVRARLRQGQRGG